MASELVESRKVFSADFAHIQTLSTLMKQPKFCTDDTHIQICALLLPIIIIMWIGFMEVDKSRLRTIISFQKARSEIFGALLIDG